MWEFFSKDASTEAGQPQGYGRGRLITTEVLESKHMLDRHGKTTGSEVTLSDETGLPPEQGGASVNPAGQLSREQARNERLAKESVAAEKAKEKQASADASAAAVTATHNRTFDCPFCAFKGSSQGRLNQHRQTPNCGRFGARRDRRIEHDANTIESRMARIDDDAADECALREQTGLDCVTVKFSQKDLGWTLGGPTDGVPHEFRHHTWSTPAESDSVKVPFALARICKLTHKHTRMRTCLHTHARTRAHTGRGKGSRGCYAVPYRRSELFWRQLAGVSFLRTSDRREAR